MNMTIFLMLKKEEEEEEEEKVDIKHERALVICELSINTNILKQREKEVGLL